MKDKSCNEYKRISLFLPDLRIGGAEKVFVNLANFFISRGIDVDVVVMNDKGVLKGDLDKNITYIHLLKESTNNPLMLLLGSSVSLMHYLRKNPPDMLISTIFGANLVATVVKSCFRLSTPIVIREASSFDNYGFVKKILMRIFYPKATSIIAVSRLGAQELQMKLSGASSKILTISNGVDMDAIGMLAKEKVNEVGEYGAYIVAVGRLVDAKAFDILITAFKSVSVINPELKLVILGDGPLRGELEALISQLGLVDKVLLPGFKRNPYPYMKRAELFVLSSRWEGFPNALVEAICLGIKVVATDCNYGPSEIFSDEMRSKLVQVGDANALSERICDVLINDYYSVSNECHKNSEVFEKYLNII